jgi:uncharacterized membrane protein YhaH (DUF805 family)
MDTFLRESRRFLDFSGRSTRDEFWSLHAGLSALAFGLFGASVFVYLFSASDDLFSPPRIAFWMAAGLALSWVVLAEIACGTRRLRDAGFNPMLITLVIVPVIGFLALLPMWAAPTRKIED